MLRKNTSDPPGSTEDTCGHCRHPWNEHDRLLAGAGKALIKGYNPKGYEDLYQCTHYEGMGNWCGCEERSRQPAIPDRM